MSFLYEELNSAKKLGFLKNDVPDFVVSNLNPTFELREYQEEAFSRFFHYFKNDFPNKTFPIHLLYNMATGSGKTIIMAGLILYLYEQGYRNFLFFVNSTNIIEKTKDNFLNNLSTKFLFNDHLVFHNKPVSIRALDNFADANPADINICFTTIQKMHANLHNEKENSLTFEDFKQHKIVLLSDEAHHIQVKTRQASLDDSLEKPNWENTVDKIFQTNRDNILLEFTATLDYSEPEIVNKYQNKVIFRYDLKQFRADGFSKEPKLLPTDTDKSGRILQAIIVNQYRQEVAGKYSINLKPVILFKAQKTIEQSHENKTLFHDLISGLSAAVISSLRKNTSVEVLQRAFAFFKAHDITDNLLVKKLQTNFAENKCLSVNEENEKEKYQILLNSLEDSNNQIRAIFAVQKLNEGWDVLNLFDIVRMYEARDSKDNRPGKTTTSEAQLIGRGARYFPFSVALDQERDRRKYDTDLDNELRVLEELHYHCHPGDKSRYITEITAALVEEGMMDENSIELKLQLKESFKKEAFYKTGIVYKNERVKTSFEKVNSIADLGLARQNVVYKLLSGYGEEVDVFVAKPVTSTKKPEMSSKDLLLSDIDTQIIRNAVTRNDFFTFENLHNYFPHLKSLAEFITKKEYLSGLGITFVGTKNDLLYFSREQKYQGVLHLLEELAMQIQNTVSEYQGTREFKPAQFKTVFTDTTVKVKIGDQRADGDADKLALEDWYVYNANYGTSLEKDFVNLIERLQEDLRKYFKKVYLVRNERQMKIFNFKDGRAFEPDFLMFLVDHKDKRHNYQIFLEPKGEHLAEHDRWKEEFLEEIAAGGKVELYRYNQDPKIKVIGVPFYSKDEDNLFKEKLIGIIK